MLRAMSGTFLDIIPVIPYRDIRAGHDFLVDVLSFSSGARNALLMPNALALRTNDKLSADGLKDVPQPR